MIAPVTLLKTTLCCMPLVLGAAIGSGVAVAMSGIVPVFVCLIVGLETAATVGAIRFVYNIQMGNPAKAVDEDSSTGYLPPYA